MKRLFIAALAIAGLICFSVPSAMAVIDNTSHDLTAGAQGACSTCHVPHKSVGSRLWPKAVGSATTTDYGEVGLLCYYCHGVGGGASFPNAVQNNIMLKASQASHSHGILAANIPAGGNNLTNATDLPYVAQSSIQCTSCHNVHDDTARPFLRKNYDILCQDCHSQRTYNNSDGPTAQFGAWTLTGANSVGDNNASGSHPVGSNITGNVSGGASPINFALTPYINLARSATIDNWVLGGHLGNNGGVMCGSCHAPHGVDMDDEPAVAALHPTNDILVFDQGEAGAAEDGGAANGNGLTNDKLCESCHYTTATTFNSGTGANYSVTSWNVTGAGGTDAGTNYAKQPNPGATAYTHPVDDLGTSAGNIVTAFPTGWPTGSNTGTNISAPNVICESCHTPHPRANAARTTIVQSTGSPILRNSAINICTNCHGTELAGHHPTGLGIMTTRFNSTSSANVENQRIGDGNADLTCGDCHGGSGGGAHNWGAPGVGLDADWVPANNARGAGDTVGGTNLPDNAANMSDSCKQCHMNTQGGTAHQSPTKNAGDAGAAVTHTWRTNSGYTDLGEGTHYIGDNLSNLYASGVFAGTAFNALSDVWDNVDQADGQGRGGWSRWYGKLGSVGCQSCHELEPDKNVPGTALLLGWYKDGDTVTNDTTNDPSSFCQGCHGATPGGGKPHPMTGATIGRAQLDGRSTPTLMTAIQTDVYLGAGAPTRLGGTSTFPAANAMNCDSCHQPHDAATYGGTYIYEAPNANVTGDAFTYPNSGHIPIRGSEITNIEDQNFCNQCHAY